VLFEDVSKDAATIAHEFNLIQDAGNDEIIQMANEILAAWPDKVAAYQSGNKGLLGLFMGELMKKSNGKANPKLASNIVQELLNKK
jgi:aspartyl-tRNA(Asn)/glutamyl-tRNA(Gln) amidotransferase subunit B